MVKTAAFEVTQKRTAEVQSVYRRAAGQIASALSPRDPEGPTPLKAALAHRRVGAIMQALSKDVAAWATKTITRAYQDSADVARTRMEILGQTLQEEPRHEERIAGLTRSALADFFWINKELARIAGKCVSADSCAGRAARQAQAFGGAAPNGAPWNSIRERLLTRLEGGEFLDLQGHPRSLVDYAGILAGRRIREARVEAMQAGRRKTVIITGKESVALLRRYLDAKEPSLAAEMTKLWNAQAEALSMAMVKRMAASGAPDPGLFDELEKLARRAIKERVMPHATRGMESAYGAIEGRFRELKKTGRIRRLQFFSTNTRTLIQQFIDNRGASLVSRLLQDGKDVVGNILRKSVLEEALSPSQLANLLRPQIGLTKQFSDAVLRKYLADLASGKSIDDAIGEAEKYATFLHKVRALNIARTELSTAYNEGQLQSMRQSMNELGGTAMKTLAAADDERTCEICGEMDGEQVGVDEPFSDGSMSAPLHNSCRCGTEYAVLT